MEVSPCGDFGDDETWNPSSEGLVTGPPTSSRPFTLVDVPLEVPASLRNAYLDNLLKYPATTPRRPRSCSPPITSATHCLAGGSRPPLPRSDQPSTSAADQPSTSRGTYESHRSRGRGGGRGRGRINASSRGISRGSSVSVPTASVSGPSRGQTGAPRGPRGSRGNRGARGRQPRGGRDASARGYPDKLVAGLYSRGIPQKTPEGFWHHLVPHHPWAHLVRPREVRFDLLSDSNVTNFISDREYWHVPSTNYDNSENFVYTLFPDRLQGNQIPPDLPFLELQTLENTISFRYRSQTVIQQVFSRNFRHIENTRPQTPADQFEGLIAPPTIDGIRPVLYQIIQTGRGAGVILEAKDFFIMMPDRPDLHCIILDQFGTNIQTNTRGFARNLVSVKDYVWVYDVEPTNAALRNPSLTLQQTQIPRTTALDNNCNFFFRVARFAFVRPAQVSQEVYGIVLSVPRRGDNAVNNIRAVFEGAPDAITVPPSICDFELTTAVQYEMVLAHTRLNTSTAVRFSEPPVSQAARAALTQAVKSFVPLHPQEAILPLRVFRPSALEQSWLADRAGPFENFRRDPASAKVRMARLFSVSCAALAAINTIDDDRHSHWVTASVPTMNAYPIRFQFQLTDMISEAGWTVQRPVELWVEGSPALSRARVIAVQARSEDRELDVTIAAYRDTDDDLVRAIRSYERREFISAERDVSIAVAAMIRIYFNYRRPQIICLTTSSLLNTSGPKGCFAEYLDSFDLLIGDEASQIPEPVFVAITDRLPDIRHIYIGDVHQLEPHARCPRSSNPAVYGARSVMSVLTASAHVSIAPLVTTFRAHPSLNELPNRLTYGGTLVSGADAAERRLLLDLFEFPDRDLPFLFVDVAGTSQRAVTKSHHNEVEASVCLTIVTELLGRGVRADQICVISFYREQFRRLAEPVRNLGIELSTVDTVQGREKDVVILLTTKTGFDPEGAEFLDDQRRMNVALTRSRHGQFVLGHVESLRQVRYWNGVLEWATEHDAVIPASDLPRFFRSD
ncbi:hypothetical protein Y032_0086g1895 [Ancylostoma ceylanicum]|nr:hypothetical protein Y032_0086g1895 [Ancylostoma ceylanicum]